MFPKLRQAYSRVVIAVGVIVIAAVINIIIRASAENVISGKKKSVQRR